MLKFCILLSWVLLSVDGEHFDISDACHKLEDCDDIISEIDFKDDNALAYVTPGLNTVCSKQTELNSCIAERESACTDANTHNYISEVQDVVEYICSSSGQKLIQNLADTECATNPDYQTRLDNVEDICMETFKADTKTYSASAVNIQPTDFCPFVTALEDCVARGTEDLCGPQMAIFVSIVYEIRVARDIRADFQCPDWVPHSLPLSTDDNGAGLVKPYYTNSLFGKMIIVLALLLVQTI